jgi:hypothetical protein
VPSCAPNFLRQISEQDHHRGLTIYLVQPRPSSVKRAFVAQYVWCPHATEAFLPARIKARLVGGNGPALQVEVRHPDGRRETMTAAETECTPIASMVALADAVDDLVQLADVNEASIVHLLRARFSQDQIYTWVGNILVAVNPFKLLPLYTPSVIDKVQHRGAVGAAHVRGCGRGLQKLEAVQARPVDSYFGRVGRGQDGNHQARSDVLVRSRRRRVRR